MNKILNPEHKMKTKEEIGLLWEDLAIAAAVTGFMAHQPSERRELYQETWRLGSAGDAKSTDLGEVELQTLDRLCEALARRALNRLRIAFSPE